MLQTRVPPVRQVGRRLLAVVPQPWWLWVLCTAALCYAVYVSLNITMALGQLTAREQQARAAEQRAFYHQQLQATQALVEEVRRLRETLEAR